MSHLDWSLILLVQISLTMCRVAKPSKDDHYAVIKIPGTVFGLETIRYWSEQKVVTSLRGCGRKGIANLSALPLKGLTLDR